MAVPLRKLVGWKDWRYVRNYVKGLNLPSAPIPDSLLPSRSFWLDSFAVHCQLYPPWSNIDDPFDAFLVAGGATGTLVGALNGLDIVNNILNEKTFAVWGIGQDYPVIQFSYNISEYYKEDVYLYLSVDRTSLLGPISYSTFSDVVQRCRLKRIYIKHGEVSSYREDGDDKILSIGLVDPLPQSLKIPSTQIMVYKKNGDILTYSIDGITVDGEFLLGGSQGNSTAVPSVGDFYLFTNAWVIEDPMLMSGFWYGQENTTPFALESVSGYNVFLTSQNRPFENNIYVSGVYVWKKISSQTTTSTTTTTEGNTETDTEENVEANAEKIFIIPAGSSMNDQEGYEWVWIPSENNSPGIEIYDDVYHGTTRYKYGEEIVDSETGAIGPVIIERTLGSQEDIEDWTDKDPSYVRIEISKGGNSYRHNWQPSCLKNEYVLQNGNYFKILYHIDSNTIDISYKAAYSSGDNNVREYFDLQSPFEIFNQNAWMITEHFMDNNNYGIFNGVANNIKDNDISIDIGPHSSGTLLKNTIYSFPYITNTDGTIINSFWARYITDYTLNDSVSNPECMWKKYNRWRVIDDSSPSSPEYLIDYNSDNVPVFRGDPLYASFPLVDNATFNNNFVHVAFDKTFSTFNGSSYKGSMTLSVTQALDLNRRTVLCLDGDWFSAPIAIDIPVNSYIGVCEGYMFGLGILTGQVNSNTGACMVITSPSSSLGLSSFFHALREEDCICYKDILSGKLTLRRGELDFREMPRKQEISTGYVQAIESPNSKDTIYFNTKYDRVKSLQIDVDNKNDGSAITFAAGKEEDYYGFYIEGKGKVDLQALRRFGIGAETYDPYIFTNTGFNVSPVYVYNQSDNVNYIKTQMIDLGLSTLNSPLYIKNGDVDNVKISYINNNQTIGEEGLYDILRCPDGEILLIFNRIVDKFFANDEPNNGAEGSIAWLNDNCIFITGTFDDGSSWGCPVVDKFNYNDDTDYQYPLMVLSGVDYFSSIYNYSNGYLQILVQGYVPSGNTFLGIYSVALLNLQYNIVKCNHEDPDKQPFLYRKPMLKQFENASENNMYSYGLFSDIVNTGDKFKEYDVVDRFIRIIGYPDTNSQISYSNSIGYPSLSRLQDGTLVILFEGIEGARMLFSDNGGLTWYISGIVLARDAYAPVFIGGDIIAYIYDNKLVVKLIDEMELLKATSIRGFMAGNSDKYYESEQKRFDSIQRYIITSNISGTHRVSGYKTPQGLIKIFYYDQDGLMVCVESQDGRKWQIANNF